MRNLRKLTTETEAAEWMRQRGYVWFREGGYDSPRHMDVEFSECRPGYVHLSDPDLLIVDLHIAAMVEAGELWRVADETPEAAYRDRAKALFDEDGHLEVREGAPIQREEGGAYVQAWLWIATEAVTNA